MSSLRDAIMEEARVLLVKHGYRGLRFADIASRLNTTRANVHYHFGSKEKLVEAVIEKYMDFALGRFRDIWLNNRSTYAEKVAEMVAFNEGRYRDFNGGLNGTSAWSLIDRMRTDRDLVSDVARSALNRIHDVDVYVTNAVELAQMKGEIRADAPVADISLQMMTIIDCAGAITQARGNFKALQDVYLGHLRIVIGAYGTNSDGKAWADRAATAAPAPLSQP